MIPFFLALLGRVGIPARFAKPVAIGLLVVFAIASFVVLKIAYDRSIIKGHTAKQEAATAKADRKADAVAAEQRRNDDTRQNLERTALKEATDEAARTGADSRAAYYRCLGLLQDARRRGQPSPKC